MKPKWLERIVRHATEYVVDAPTELSQYDRMRAEYNFRLPYANRNVSADLAVAMLQEIKRLRRRNDRK